LIESNADAIVRAFSINGKKTREHTVQTRPIAFARRWKKFTVFEEMHDLSDASELKSLKWFITIEMLQQRENILSASRIFYNVYNMFLYIYVYDVSLVFLANYCRLILSLS